MGAVKKPGLFLREQTGSARLPRSRGRCLLGSQSESVWIYVHTRDSARSAGVAAFVPDLGKASCWPQDGGPQTGQGRDGPVGPPSQGHRRQTSHSNGEQRVWRNLKRSRGAPSINLLRSVYSNILGLVIVLRRGKEAAIGVEICSSSLVHRISPPRYSLLEMLPLKASRTMMFDKHNIDSGTGTEWSEARSSHSRTPCRNSWRTICLQPVVEVGFSPGTAAARRQIAG
jgi:hypothetical protein